MCNFNFFATENETTESHSKETRNYYNKLKGLTKKHVKTMIGKSPEICPEYSRGRAPV